MRLIFQNDLRNRLYSGADLGGGRRGCATPPPSLIKMKLYSYSLLKFVSLTGQRRQSLELHPLLRKILDSPLVLFVRVHIDFLADQISCRSYVRSVYCLRSVAVSRFSFMYIRRSFQIRYDAAFKRGAGHAFKCLGWPCQATLIFLLFETPIVTLCPLLPETRAVAKRVLRRK